jgi:hypothetical protein
VGKLGGRRFQDIVVFKALDFFNGLIQDVLQGGARIALRSGKTGPRVRPNGK